MDQQGCSLHFCISAFLHFCISAFLHFCISAFLVVDDDTGLIEIGINFRPQDTRPEYIRHETAVRIRAQVVNEIFSLYIILKELTKYAVCIGCELIKETGPVVLKAYQTSCERQTNLGFKEITRAFVNLLKETTIIEQAKQAGVRSLLPCVSSTTSLRSLRFATEYVGRPSIEVSNQITGTDRPLNRAQSVAGLVSGLDWPNGNGSQDS